MKADAAWAQYPQHSQRKHLPTWNGQEMELLMHRSCHGNKPMAKWLLL